MPVLTILNSPSNDDFFFIWVRSCWGRIFWETNAQHCKRPHCHLTRRHPKNKMQVRIAPGMLDFLGCIDYLGTVWLRRRVEQRLLHGQLGAGAVCPHVHFCTEENLMGCNRAGRKVSGQHSAWPDSLCCKGARAKSWVSTWESLWEGDVPCLRTWLENPHLKIGSDSAPLQLKSFFRSLSISKWQTRSPGHAISSSHIYRWA